MSCGQDLMVNIQANLRIYCDGSVFMWNIGMKYQIRLRISPLFSMDENLGKYSTDPWFCKHVIQFILMSLEDISEYFGESHYYKNLTF